MKNKIISLLINEDLIKKTEYTAANEGLTLEEYIRRILNDKR